MRSTRTRVNSGIAEVGRSLPVNPIIELRFVGIFFSSYASVKPTDEVDEAGLCVVTKLSDDFTCCITQGKIVEVLLLKILELSL